MRYPSGVTELMTLEELRLIHQRSVELLESPGIMIDHDGFLDALAAKGARVDRARRVAQLPPVLTEQAALETAGGQCILNSDFPAVSKSLAKEFRDTAAKQPTFAISGSCLEVIAEDGFTSRTARYEDIERVVRFGDGHPRVGSINAPLLHTKGADGRDIPPDLRPIYGMTYMAKHCAKLGAYEIWTARDLDYAVKLGELVMGGPEAYRRNPVLISIKCSISPLKIDARSAEVLYELARRGLPMGICPMPIGGASTPVTVASGILIANAEILGVASAAWAAGLSHPHGHGILGSILDMRTTMASFSSPNALLMDAGLSQVQRLMYGRTVMAATDYVDAKYPGYQSGSERAFKIAALAACGIIMPSVGQLKAGLVFSPEQACLDMEAFDWMYHYLRGFEVSDDTLCVELIRERGIGGNFLDADHTAEHYRQEFFMPLLSDRFGNTRRDALEAARDEVERIVDSTPQYFRDPEICREIDRLFDVEVAGQTGSR